MYSIESYINTCVKNSESSFEIQIKWDVLQNWCGRIILFTARRKVMKNVLTFRLMQ